MYVVVAGAGHMGTHLVSRLVAAGHETAVIDVDQTVTERLFAEQGVVVYTGSATDVSVAAESPIAGRPVADVVKREHFPRGCLFIASELASGEVQLIEGNTVIRGGSRVIMAAPRADLPRLLRYLGSAGAKAAPGSLTEVLHALGQVGFLSGVSQESLAELAAGARVESRPSGEEIYRAAEAGETFYVLRKGAVELEAAGGARVREPAELVVVAGTVLRASVLRNPFLALELAKALSDRPRRGGTV